MKIEICEQLVASWLKHIKGCQIVETNWCPSPIALDPDDKAIDRVIKFIDDVKMTVNNDEIDIFKKSTPKQFIMQCEIDVVGLKIADTVIEELYLVDSAFHSISGIGYKNPVATVIKKILRAIVVSDLAFNKIPSNVIFAAPKCGNSLKDKLANTVKQLDSVIKKHYPDSTAVLLFNEDFYSEIYAPLVAVSDKISDDNDLFARSMKVSKTAQSYSSKAASPKQTAPKTPRGDNKKTVFSILNGLKAKGVLDGALLSDLCNPIYAKKHFDISTYPVLISVSDFKISGFEESRFYKDEYFEISGTDYMVCSQWIPEKIRKLQNWYDKI